VHWWVPVHSLWPCRLPKTFIQYGYKLQTNVVLVHKLSEGINPLKLDGFTHLSEIAHNSHVASCTYLHIAGLDETFFQGIL
jgi:hypothetical protein